MPLLLQLLHAKLILDAIPSTFAARILVAVVGAEGERFYWLATLTQGAAPDCAFVARAPRNVDVIVALDSVSADRIVEQGVPPSSALIAGNKEILAEFFHRYLNPPLKASEVRKHVQAQTNRRLS